jgi:hypothetical protein
MADEREANVMFHRQKQHMLTLLGKEALDDKQINKLCRHLFLSKWGGCKSNEEVDLKIKNRYYILNTGGTKSGGVHWTACVVGAGKSIYLYDSFGRPTGLILKSLKRQADRLGLSVKESKRDAEQRGQSAVCGQISIAWLCVVKQMGVKAALLI